MNSCLKCLCCLMGDPDKDLTTPYTYLGKTEIYSHMLKECFDLQLTLEGDSICGICSSCVGRLRDASEFKLQVQYSQARLRSQLRGVTRVKEENLAVKSELEDDNGNSDEPVLFEPEIHLEEDPPCSETDQEMTDDLALGPPLVHDAKPLHGTNQMVIIKQELPVPELVPITPATSHQQPSDTPPTHERHASDTPTTHERHASDTDINPYECGVCSEKFQHLSLLSLHVSTVHKKKPTPRKCTPTILPKGTEFVAKNKTSEKVAPKSKRTPKVTNTYPCVTCGVIFATKGSLYLHMRKHENKKISCEICEKEFSSLSNFLAHKRSPSSPCLDKTYKCDICKRPFSHSSLLIKHRRTHR